MNKVLSHIYLIVAAFMMMACQSNEAKAMPPTDASTGSTQVPNGDSKTLVVYYSYTGSCRDIVTTLTSQISADVVEILAAEKGLHYEANGYALGTQLLNAIKANPNDASSYPAIDPVTVSLDDYNTILIVTPLWWSQMAAIMQTFLFNNGKEMAGKNIGLIVSSASSGISGVVSDCKRLVPDGKYFSQNLWINDSNRSNRSTLIQNWLKVIGYNENQNENTMNLKVNDNTLKVNLADNAATLALLERLNNGAVTYNAHDYGGFEKVGSLGFTLPSNDTYITTEPGDIMLYTSNQLCIFFDSNSWEYTRIGKIEGMTAQQLKDVFGTGEVSITLTLDNTVGIVSASVNKAKANNIYTLNGQKVAHAHKGIYIVNGEKQVVK